MVSQGTENGGRGPAQFFPLSLPSREDATQQTRMRSKTQREKEKEENVVCVQAKKKRKKEGRGDWIS